MGRLTRLIKAHFDDDGSPNRCGDGSRPAGGDRRARARGRSVGEARWVTHPQRKTRAFARHFLIRA